MFSWRLFLCWNRWNRWNDGVPSILSFDWVSLCDMHFLNSSGQNLIYLYWLVSCFIIQEEWRRPIKWKPVWFVLWLVELRTCFQLLCSLITLPPCKHNNIASWIHREQEKGIIMAKTTNELTVESNFLVCVKMYGGGRQLCHVGQWVDDSAYGLMAMLITLRRRICTNVQLLACWKASGYTSSSYDEQQYIQLVGSHPSFPY